MRHANRMRKLVDASAFMETARNYGPERIQCSSHTFFRLSQRQRAVFTCDSIRHMLLNEVPLMVGIQNNGCHAAFYKYRKQRVIRIIVGMKADRMEVVTFYVIEEKRLPVVR